MSDEFWVDVEGLDRSAAGWDEKARRIEKVRHRLGLLSGSNAFSALGGDSAGTEVHRVAAKISDDLDDALHGWSEAVGNTGTSLRNSADRFQSQEDAGTEAGRALTQRIDEAAGSLPTDPDAGGRSRH